MVNSKFDTATFVWKWKRKTSIGISVDINQDLGSMTPTPVLRYYFKSFDDIHLFGNFRAEGLLDGGGRGGGGLEGVRFSLGAEYFIKKDFSAIIFFHGGGGLNIQYYF